MFQYNLAIFFSLPFPCTENGSYPGWSRRQVFLLCCQASYISGCHDTDITLALVFVSLSIKDNWWQSEQIKALYLWVTLHHVSLCSSKWAHVDSGSKPFCTQPFVLLEMIAKAWFFLYMCWLQKWEAPVKPVEKQPWNLRSWAASQLICLHVCHLLTLHCWGLEAKKSSVWLLRTLF